MIGAPRVWFAKSHFACDETLADGDFAVGFYRWSNCLCGPEAEKEFCGAITDGSDKTDYEMAHEYLTRELGPLQIGAAFARYRDAAQRLVALTMVGQHISAKNASTLAVKGQGPVRSYKIFQRHSMRSTL